MPSDLENLRTIRSNYLTRLAALSDPAAKIKLTYSVDGQSFSWTEYQKYLSDQIELYNRLIQQAGTFMIVSRGRS